MTWCAHGGISKIFFLDHFSPLFLGQKYYFLSHIQFWPGRPQLSLSYIGCERFDVLGGQIREVFLLQIQYRSKRRWSREYSPAYYESREGAMHSTMLPHATPHTPPRRHTTAPPRRHTTAPPRRHTTAPLRRHTPHPFLLLTSCRSLFASFASKPPRSPWEECLHGLENYGL